jgi:hypothetical protein
LPWSPVAATTTTSPRFIGRLAIGCVEVGNGFNPVQRVVFASFDQKSDLNGDASADRLQARIGNDESQFA